MEVLNIVLLVLTLSSLIGSFINPDKNYDIFSVDVDIWVYRGFWLIIIIGISYELYKIFKKEKVERA